MTPRFPCRGDAEGRLVPMHPERTMRYRDKEVWISLHLKPTLVKRSDAGNKYLWGVVYATIARETGNDPEAVHYGLKRLAVEQGVLEPTYILLGDLPIEDEPTTVVESDVFWAYVAWIRSLALAGKFTGGPQYPLYIPEPNEEAA
jgi:hypothetical protein